MKVYIVIDDARTIQAVFGKRDSAEQFIKQQEAELNGYDLIQLGYISKLNWAIEEHHFHPPAIKREVIQVWEARLSHKGRITVIDNHWVCAEDTHLLKPYKCKWRPPIDISFYSTVSEEDAIAQAEEYKSKG